MFFVLDVSEMQRVEKSVRDEVFIYNRVPVRRKIERCLEYIDVGEKR